MFKRLLFLSVTCAAISLSRAAPKSSPPSSPLSSSPIKITRAKVMSYAGDLDETLSTAEMEIHKIKGKTEGFRFKSIEKTSVFRTLGFLPGDIVHKVNDQTLTSPGDAMAMLPSLLTGLTESYVVQFVRDGKPLTQKFEITDD